MTQPRVYAVLAALVLSQAPPLAAQPRALRGLGGVLLNAAGSSAVLPPQAAGGAVPEQPRQGNPILGTFWTETDEGRELWRWRQNDSDLSSEGLRSQLKDMKKLGKPLEDWLDGTAGKQWLVVRKPVKLPDGGKHEAPVFLFTGDKPSEIFFAPIAESRSYGTGQDALKLPAELKRDGERLSVVYGDAASGLREVHRFSPKDGGDALVGFFEYAQDPKTKAPALVRARLFTDGESLAELLRQPGMAGTAGVKSLSGNAELIKRLGAKLGGEKSLSVSVDRFGNAQFNAHADAKDKSGTPALYLIDGEIVEVGAKE